MHIASNVIKSDQMKKIKRFLIHAINWVQ